MVELLLFGGPGLGLPGQKRWGNIMTFLVNGGKIREITDRGNVFTDLILKLINFVRTAGKKRGL